MSQQATLTVEHLSVSYDAGDTPLRAVRDVSFSIAPGEAYGLIGESGSGKTTVAFAMMNYLRGGRIEGGRILLQGQPIQDLPKSELRQIRGNKVAMVYQDPMSSLNPGIRVGEQIAEALRYHGIADRAGARARAVRLLADVNLPDPEAMVDRYPHQLSGGQQQRIVIAMALACEPDLVIMDEPTTGLDVTTEAVILDLIRELRHKINASILFISHNIAVVAKVCDRVGVLYAGELVEEGRVAEVIRRPKHPYTVGLVASMPSGTDRSQRLASIKGSLPDLTKVPQGCIFADRCLISRDVCLAGRPPAIEVGPAHISRCLFPDEAQDVIQKAEARVVAPARAAGPAETVMHIDDLKLWYTRRRGLRVWHKPQPVRAVNGVTLDIEAGRTLAVVGESGSGKSTLARCVVGLVPPTGGAIEFHGERLGGRARQRGVKTRQRIQIIFQNPESALNPQRTVGEIIARPLKLYNCVEPSRIDERVAELMKAVNLPARYASRYPHQLSGGEKQRVSIARVLGTEPDLIICDEPTSALDISVQAAVLNALSDLQARHGLSYMFISHDLGVVRYISDRVAVMYLGVVVETGPTEAVFKAPHHPYTESLVAALPDLSGNGEKPEVRLQGTPPSPTARIKGCVFASRCPRKVGAICETTPPPVQNLADGRKLACHIPVDELARLQGAVPAVAAG